MIKTHNHITSSGKVVPAIKAEVLNTIVEKALGMDPGSIGVIYAGRGDVQIWPPKAPRVDKDAAKAAKVAGKPLSTMNPAMAAMQAQMAQMAELLARLAPAAPAEVAPVAKRNRKAVA